MEVTEAEWKRKVFRLRRVNSHVVALSEVAEMLSKGFGDISVDEIDVKSLATTLEWESSLSRVATLQFKTVPSLLRRHLSDEEWDLSACCSCEGLTLDCHFLGLTPLNDVKEPQIHIADCIAMSGLGSHPFGSWQPRGPQKAFMWIRDELPSYTPGIRTILYGHDSHLIDSTSCQLISDIARDFIEQLRLGHWTLKSAKPLVFLAHSLGGLILKDALVEMADATDNLNNSLLDKVIGAVMFGVPNIGMEQSHLFAMVEGQPNETLVEDLARGSNYLSRLDKSFSGIMFQRKITIFWAYETSQSPTVIPNEDGTGWDRNGPPAVLVSSHSATCRLDLKKSSMVFPINEDHSNMVKFPRNSNYTKIVGNKVAQICKLEKTSQKPRQNFGPEEIISVSSQAAELVADKAATNGPSKEVEDILVSLDAPDLDLRVDIIEEHLESTSEWVFQLTSFTDWLEGGTGIFWINGKPGSGKSTLMKFIFKDRRTQDLLHDWRRGTKEILAGFFFHYRGSPMQKSFEGVLRSLVRQIIKAEPQLHTLLQALFKQGFDKNKQWSIPELEKALRLLLCQGLFELDICLFFDALDEFDGHPNQISRFLKDLVDIPAQSSTKVKVCFSSRPWDAFVTNFGDCPKFSLHENTGVDIRNYCVGIASRAEHPAQSLLRLVPDIVKRAKGVFLWVTLVMRDLMASALPPHSKSAEELRVILEQLPLELDQYYEHIIDRMALSHRWETYVLLELLIRTSEHLPSLNLGYVASAVTISDCHTFQQAEERLTDAEADLMSAQQLKQRISLWGGGLVELYQSNPGIPSRSDFVNVMHQTVFDFVTDLRFKQRVLGNQAKITSENGHAFHVKYLMIKHGRSRPNRVNVMGEWEALATNEHVRLAEITTGQSQEEFLTSVPETFFDNLGVSISREKYFSGGVAHHFSDRMLSMNCLPRTLFEFAAWSCLMVFLRDWTEANPKELPSMVPRRDFPASLLECCYHGRFLSPKSNVVSTMEILLDNGCNPLQEPEIFETILQELVYGKVDGHMRSTLTSLCCLFLEKGQDPNRQFSNGSKRQRPHPLHIAPFAVAVKLLEYGANPSVRNQTGKTRLDIELEIASQTGDIEVLTRSHDIICAILRKGRGAWQKEIKGKVLAKALESFEGVGLDTNLIDEYLCIPPWCPEQEITEDQKESEGSKRESRLLHLPRRDEPAQPTSKSSRKRLWAKWSTSLH